MINHQHKFIFVHIPKTGGTAIEKVFDESADVKDVRHKHDSLRVLLELDGQMMQYFKFSVVRNPFDLVCSMYYYMWHSQYSWPIKWRSAMPKDILLMSFEDWVQHPEFNAATLRTGELFILKSHENSGDVLQSDWLVNWNGDIALDHLCRFESLQSDFDVVCHKIGVSPQSLKYIFKSKTIGYRDYYNRQTKRIVARKYEKDIDSFGYVF